MWWHVSVFVALGSWRQEDWAFRFILGREFEDSEGGEGGGSGEIREIDDK